MKVIRFKEKGAYHFWIVTWKGRHFVSDKLLRAIRLALKETEA